MASGDFPQQAKLLIGADWPGDPPPKFLWSSRLPDGAVYKVHPAATVLAIALAVGKFGDDIIKILGLDGAEPKFVRLIWNLITKTHSGTLTAQDVRAAGDLMAGRRLTLKRRGL